MKWHVLALQNVSHHQQTGPNQVLLTTSVTSFTLIRGCGASEKKTNQHHDDTQKRPKVERPLQKEHTWQCTKLCELVDEKLAASDAEAIRSSSVSIALTPGKGGIQHLNKGPFSTLQLNRVLARALSGVVMVCGQRSYSMIKATRD